METVRTGKSAIPRSAFDMLYLCADPDHWLHGHLVYTHTNYLNKTQRDFVTHSAAARHRAHLQHRAMVDWLAANPLPAEAENSGAGSGSMVATRARGPVTPPPKRARSRSESPPRRTTNLTPDFWTSDQHRLALSLVYNYMCRPEFLATWVAPHMSLRFDGRTHVVAAAPVQGHWRRKAGLKKCPGNLALVCDFDRSIADLSWKDKREEVEKFPILARDKKRLRRGRVV